MTAVSTTKKFERKKVVLQISKMRKSPPQSPHLRNHDDLTTTMDSYRLLLLLLLVVAPRNTESFIPYTGLIFQSYQHHFFSAKSSTNEVSSAEAVPTTTTANNSDNDDDDDDESPLSSLYNNLDPYSEIARTIIVDELGLTEHIYQQLTQLSELVTEWNEKINLISRKDCNPSTVFGRHILPCVAVVAAATTAIADDNDDGVDDDDKKKKNPLTTAKTAIDVGTGGGFPGLPLAILYPNIDFVLLDSVGKKLMAVQAMADALQLKNVQIHHGRAEDWTAAGPRRRRHHHHRRFDVATGRSVSAIPQFCAWMHHLLEPQTGHLLYWIGGDVADDLLNKTSSQTAIQDLLPCVESDKRILVFPATAVSEIARESGIKVQRQQSPPLNNKRKNKPKPLRNKSSRGAWTKKSHRDDEPKDRGYSRFQRYSSTSWGGSETTSRSDNNNNNNSSDDGIDDRYR